MSLLLTVYQSPAWKTFVNVSGLTLINEATPVVNAKAAILRPTQSIITVSALLSGLTGEQKLMLAVVQAEHYLAHALESGRTLEEAAQKWEQKTVEVLALQRQQRKKLQLFNVHQALEHPTEFRSLLSPEITINEYSEHPVNSNFSLLAASQYLIQRPELQSLNTRLQASALPLCESERLTLNIDQIILQNHNKSAVAEERDLILNQLQQVQEQLEEKHAASAAELAEVCKARDHALDQVKQIKEQLEVSVAASKNELAEVYAERDLILTQLHQVQEQLEANAVEKAKEFAKARAERDKAVQDAKEANTERQALQQVCNKLETSLKGVNEERDKALHDINRVTTEYQALQQACNKLESTLKATSEERDLILAQLQQVQEQLEQYYLSLQTERQNNKHALLARDKQQAKETAKLEAELRKTKAKASNAEYAGLLMHQELDKLRKSISWKAARPVRVLGRLVRKKDPKRDKLMQDVGLLLTSEYFDVEWYLRTYPDVAESQMNPAEHYLLHGAAEGRLPGPLFDGNWYMQHYPDVSAANINPLLHFILYGQEEGRSSSPILLTNNSPEAGE